MTEEGELKIGGKVYTVFDAFFPDPDRDRMHIETIYDGIVVGIGELLNTDPFVYAYTVKFLIAHPGSSPKLELHYMQGTRLFKTRKEAIASCDRK